ncbi:MAG: serine proteinase [Oscillospiraceae bacterium]|nr:serine proteinase [Oscillospiraceae bacterium]
MAFDLNSLKAKAKELTDTGMSKARELTDTGMAKARELTEISKLKVQNVSEQDEIRRAYMELGKLYYAQHADAPEEGYAELCAKVTEANAKIAYNNERIADIKAAGNLSDDDLPADSDSTEL